MTVGMGVGMGVGMETGDDSQEEVDSEEVDIEDLIWRSACLACAYPCMPAHEHTTRRRTHSHLGVVLDMGGQAARSAEAHLRLTKQTLSARPDTGQEPH